MARSCPDDSQSAFVISIVNWGWLVKLARTQLMTHR